MSLYRRGDVVSLSRAQATRFSVASVPGAPDTPYTVTLPVNDVGRAFEYLGQPGQTEAEVAAGLLAVLLDQQTVYSAALDEDSSLVVVGKLGVSFAVSSSPNVTSSGIWSAVSAVEGHTGRQIGPIRILAPTNTLERLREFWTRDRDGNLLQRNLLQGRELDTSHVYDFDASSVLTVIHREGL